MAPDSPEVLRDRARDLWNSGDYDGALEQIDRVIEESPDNSQIISMLPNVFSYSPASWDESRPPLLTVVQRHPENPYVLHELLNHCVVWYRGSCKSVGETLKNRQPETGNGEVLLVFAAPWRGRESEVEELVAQALYRNPNNAHALQIHAHISLTQGRIEEAQRAIRRVNELAPNLPRGEEFQGLEEGLCVSPLLSELSQRSTRQRPRS